MKNKRTAEATSEAPEHDVFDDQIALRQQVAAAPDQSAAGGNAPVAENNSPHAAAVEKKKYTPAPDPLGLENIRAGQNRVRLLKSEGHQAWVIRFDKSPNEMEGYSKENPHPVIKMLKDEGYRWGFDDGDGKGGWGKRWTDDAYGADHIDARDVLAKAAEMIGGPKQQEQAQSR